MIDKYYVKSLLGHLLGLAFVVLFFYLIYLFGNWFVSDFWGNTKFILKWFGITLLALIAISLVIGFFQMVSSEAKKMRKAAKKNEDESKEAK